MTAHIKDEFDTGSGSVDSKYAEDWRKIAREISWLDIDDSESPHSVWSGGTISPEAIARGTITADKIMYGRFTKDSATEESVPYIEKVRRTAEASDLIEKYKLYEDKRITTKKTKSTGDSTWRMTSVRYLEQEHPEYVRTIGKKSATDRLFSALSAMSYFEAEVECKIIIGFTGAELRKTVVDTWTRDDHDEMVRFLDHGGYRARRDELRARAEADTADAEADIYAPEEVKGFDVVEVKTDTPKKESEETIEDILCYTSPEAGSW